MASPVQLCPPSFFRSGSTSASRALAALPIQTPPKLLPVFTIYIFFKKNFNLCFFGRQQCSQSRYIWPSRFSSPRYRSHQAANDLISPRLITPRVQEQLQSRSISQIPSCSTNRPTYTANAAVCRPTGTPDTLPGPCVSNSPHHLSPPPAPRALEQKPIFAF